MTEPTAKTPIEWAALACDTLMAKFRAEGLPPAGRFHRHPDVFPPGMERCREQTRDPRYFSYVKSWVDSLAGPNGHIGDYALYAARPTGVNGLHGVGAFLIMCDEMSRA